MLTIACQTLTCLQMYLGVGYIVKDTPDTLIYYSLPDSKNHVCTKSGSVLKCGSMAEQYEEVLKRRYNPHYLFNRY